MNYADELLKRVQQVKQKHRLSVSQIAKQAEMAKSTAQNQIHGKFKLDIDLVGAILELCPDVSAEWLMRSIEQHDPHPQAVMRRLDELEQKLLHIIEEEERLKQQISNQ